MVHECKYNFNNYDAGIKRQRVFTTSLYCPWSRMAIVRYLKDLPEDTLVEAHLRIQSLEIQDKAINCITDHCVAVGRLIISQFANKPTR